MATRDVWTSSDEDDHVEKVTSSSSGESMDAVLSRLRPSQQEGAPHASGGDAEDSG